MPPAVDGPRQVLNEALAAFEKIKVQAVESEQAGTVGQEASRLIAVQ